MIVHALKARFSTPLPLDLGGSLPEFNLAYEAYGRLNADASNAILILHALSSTSHAAGIHHPSDTKPGWWDSVIGPGKLFDTDRFFVVCSNVLGGWAGSTSPADPNPLTGTPYGLHFPTLTIADMVRAQHQLMHLLGIQRWHALAGGCMGGFQALEWLRLFPQHVGRALLVGTSWKTSAHTIARNAVLRQALMSDPLWNHGDYYHGPQPQSGPALAATIGTLIWFDPSHLETKHGRKRLPTPPSPQASERFAPQFQIEALIARIAAAAPGAFDSNSMLYLTKAMDLFDLTAHGPMETVFAHCRTPTLLVSIDSDWRYPAAEGGHLVNHLLRAGCPAEHRLLQSPLGHGAFFLDPAAFTAVVGDYLEPIKG